MKSGYLFSVDVEDIRLLIENGERFRDAVAEMTLRYLEFLQRADAKATFFVVGDVARRHPELIRQIADAGHEIGCHTDKHVPLDRQTPGSFRADLEQNLDSLRRAGAGKITGFRAPIFSLTEKTRWAYDVLSELGFMYSSSVLPAKNPLYGWAEFGEAPRTIQGIVEIPMTLSNTPLLNIPFGGGLYFRVLPRTILNLLFRRAANDKRPIGGYFHPYDIDTEQERFMQPGIDGNRFYNFLMYYNRHSVFSKLQAVLDAGFEILTYREYVSRLGASQVV